MTPEYQTFIHVVLNFGFLEGGSNSVSEDDEGESADLKSPIFSVLCFS
jgi:hypothetical protein